jgi:hypothetical protein
VGNRRILPPGEARFWQAPFRRRQVPTRRVLPASGARVGIDWAAGAAARRVGRLDRAGPQRVRRRRAPNERCGLAVGRDPVLWCAGGAQSPQRRHGLGDAHPGAGSARHQHARQRARAPGFPGETAAAGGVIGWVSGHPLRVSGQVVAVLDIAFPHALLAIEIDGWASRGPTSSSDPNRCSPPSYGPWPASAPESYRQNRPLESRSCR